MAASVVFYCGAHKTASSMLRSYLSRNAVEIRRTNGVRSYDRKLIVAHPFFDVVRRYSRGQDVGPEDLERGVQSFSRLIDARADIHLFHNEDFFSALFFENAGKIARYLSRLAGDRSKALILYVRSQPDYLESWYMQQVHAGRIEDFDAFLGRVDLSSLSWYRVLREIDEAFDGRLIVRPYETIRQGQERYLSEFLDLVLDGAEWPAPGDLGSVNRSFSDVAYEIARTARPLVTQEEWAPLRRYLQRHFSTATHGRKAFLGPERRGELLRLHAASNRLLFEAYLPDHDPVELGYLPPARPGSEDGGAAGEAVFRFRVDGGHYRLSGRALNGAESGSKAFLAVFRYLDEAGELLPGPYPGLHPSRFGFYRYVAGGSPEAPAGFALDLELVDAVAEIEVVLMKYRHGEGILLSDAPVLAAGSGASPGSR